MVFRAGGVWNQCKNAATDRVKARNGTAKSNVKGLGRTFQTTHFGHFWLPGRSVHDQGQLVRVHTNPIPMATHAERNGVGLFGARPTHRTVSQRVPRTPRRTPRHTCKGPLRHPSDTGRRGLTTPSIRDSHPSTLRPRHVLQCWTLTGHVHDNVPYAMPCGAHGHPQALCQARIRCPTTLVT